LTDNTKKNSTYATAIAQHDRKRGDDKVAWLLSSAVDSLIHFARHKKKQRAGKQNKTKEKVDRKRPCWEIMILEAALEKRIINRYKKKTVFAASRVHN
jgi:hypothetical protein